MLACAVFLLLCGSAVAATIVLCSGNNDEQRRRGAKKILKDKLQGVFFSFERTQRGRAPRRSHALGDLDDEPDYADDDNDQDDVETDFVSGADFLDRLLELSHKQQ